MSSEELVKPIWMVCYTCRDYADHRKEVLAGPLAKKARREGRSVLAVVDEFMHEAHNRHVRTGQPLRPGGPTRTIHPALGRIAALMGVTDE
jgi:hypothetical protein